MEYDFTEAADKVERDLFETGARAYDSLWNVLDRIADDPEEGKFTFGTEYVSSRRVWATKIPGTDLTVYWRPDGDVLQVMWILDDPGI